MHPPYSQSNHQLSGKSLWVDKLWQQAVIQIALCLASIILFQNRQSSIGKRKSANWHQRVMRALLRSQRLADADVLLNQAPMLYQLYEQALEVLTDHSVCVCLCMFVTCRMLTGLERRLHCWDRRLLLACTLRSATPDLHSQHLRKDDRLRMSQYRAKDGHV